MHAKPALALLLVGAATSSAQAQIHRVAEMNTEQLRALDRAKTVVLLPGGILEEHGPYLPSFTDGFRNERLTQDLARAIVQRNGWNVLVFPMIPLGSGGGNQIGGRYSWSGTYAIRMATLRAIFMDLATELGEQGFRWVFVVHSHGAPNHHMALDQAGDFFRDTYGGHMVNLFGLVRMETIAAIGRLMTDAERAEDRSAIDHGGIGETSQILYLRPDLVDPAVTRAAPMTSLDRARTVELARSPGWPGYLGSPRLASAAFGAAAWTEFSTRTIDLALSILGGFDYRRIQRYGDTIAGDSVTAGALANDQERERKQSAWLQSKGIREMEESI